MKTKFSIGKKAYDEKNQQWVKVEFIEQVEGKIVYSVSRYGRTPYEIFEKSLKSKIPSPKLLKSDASKM